MLEMDRTFAIGDIHGCALALEAILQQIQPAAEDLVVTLGDYVDRGPDSKGVLDQLLELQHRCHLVPLLGNHELMMLAALEAKENLPFWLQCGGAATVQSYGGELGNIPEAHRQFLSSCVKYYETDTHLFFHANYDAELPLEEQPDELLFWEHLVFYDNGSHTIPARHFSGKVAIVGHTPQKNGEILDLGDVICIDTFCAGSGKLTAIELPSGQLFQADKDGTIT